MEMKTHRKQFRDFYVPGLVSWGRKMQWHISQLYGLNTSVQSTTVQDTKARGTKFNFGHASGDT